jgi:hypothetical protein
MEFPASLKSSRELFSKTAYGKTPKKSLPDLAPYTTFDYFSINPDKYLYDVVCQHRKEGNTGDLNRRLETCFIPYKADDPEFQRKVSIDKFDQFLTDRAEMIIQRIHDVVGDSWHAPSEDEDSNLEDDEFVDD